jgi:hypothetical protein
MTLSSIEINETPFLKSGPGPEGVGAKLYVVESDDHHAFLVEDAGGQMMKHLATGRKAHHRSKSRRSAKEGNAASQVAPKQL